MSYCSDHIARQPADPLGVDCDSGLNRRALPVRSHAAPRRLARIVHVALVRLPVLLREALHHSHQILAAGVVWVKAET